jgi:hypothetical protein
MAPVDDGAGGRIRLHPAVHRAGADTMILLNFQFYLRDRYVIRSILVNTDLSSLPSITSTASPVSVNIRIVG